MCLILCYCVLIPQRECRVFDLRLNAKLKFLLSYQLSN
jgi:hypothetical protein